MPRARGGGGDREPHATARSVPEEPHRIDVLVGGTGGYDDVEGIDEEVEKLNKEKEDAVANQDFEKAANLRDQAEKLRKKKDKITQEWREKSQQTDGVVDEEIIAEVVSKMTVYSKVKPS